jgi:hypothetical protein
LADHQKKIPAENVENSIDSAVNARLTRHLMDNAVRPPVEAPQEQAEAGLWSRMVTNSGIAFLMATLRIFSLLDRQQRVL